MANNPFYVQPQGDYGKQLAGLGNVLGEMGKQKKAEARFKEVQGAMTEAWRSQDPQKMAEVSIQYPEAQQTMSNLFGFYKDAQGNEPTKEIVASAYQRALSDPDNAETYIADAITQVTDAGGKPNNLLTDLGMLRTNKDAALQNMRMGYASVEPEGYKAYEASRGGGKPVSKQMGTGEMAGYVFDPTTGSFSIDPKIKETLAAKAKAEKAAADSEGRVVDAKTRQGINKDVTALTKDTKFIYNAANDLEKLKGSSSAASKLAAVFKFMKALDPTSVVRESEQGQVYSAQGGAAQIAGMLNNLVGEGKLTDAGFADIVNTSKVLAKSAVSASGEELKTYLDTYEDTLPESFKASLISRLPVIEQTPESVDVDVEAVAWAKANPNDPRSVEILRLQGVK